jgi:hypothetical protein
LLLLLALLVTLPGVRHPLPLLGLAIFAFFAWRALSRWTKAPEAVRSIDDEVAVAAAAWDHRHGPPEDVDEAAEEPWRASLRPSDAWRARDDDELN